jgi:acyl carrier protein
MLILDIEQKITDHVREILSLANKSHSNIAPHQALIDEIGMDSLELARLFIALEDEFQIDPFAEEFSVGNIQTIADLTRIYSALLSRPAA